MEDAQHGEDAQYSSQDSQYIKCGTAPAQPAPHGCVLQHRPPLQDHPGVSKIQTNKNEQLLSDTGGAVDNFV